MSRSYEENLMRIEQALNSIQDLLRDGHVVKAFEAVQDLQHEVRSIMQDQN